MLRKYWKNITKNFVVGLIGSLGLMAVILFFLLPEVFSLAKDQYYRKPLIAVESVFQVLTHFHNKAGKGELTQEEAQSQASEVIRALRYEGIEYFWINTTEPKMVMHPFKTELEGKDLSQVKDPTGKAPFNEMVKVSVEKGAGFVEYMWPKQGEDKPVAKTSYVKIFKPWNWIIGTGIYLNDMQAKINELKNLNYGLMALGVVFLVLVTTLFSIQSVKKFNIPVTSAVTELDHRSGDLGQHSDDVLVSSTDLSSNVQSQSAAIHELAQTVRIIRENSSVTLDNSEKSTNRTLETQTLIKKCQVLSEDLNASVNQVIEAQDEMINVVGQNFQSVKDLEQKFENITSSVTLINDIVFQTKLLSFNASVEAARAGQSGKGFAVVASEIGNLAASSGASAQSIVKVIDQTQEDITNLVQESESKIAFLSKGISDKISIATDAIVSFQTIFDDVIQKGDALVQEQRTNHGLIEEQSEAMDAMTEAIIDLEEKNASNNQLAQSNDLSAKELSELVVGINEVIENLSKLAASDQDVESEAA